MKRRLVMERGTSPFELGLDYADDKTYLWSMGIEKVVDCTYSCS